MAPADNQENQPAIRVLFNEMIEEEVQFVHDEDNVEDNNNEVVDVYPVCLATNSLTKSSKIVGYIIFVVDSGTTSHMFNTIEV